MTQERTLRRKTKSLLASKGRALVLLAGSGLLFSSSCGFEELEAIIVGVDAAASHLEGDRDISFTDWLASEFDDLNL